MYGFLAGFSSPESIFANKNTYFLFCDQNRKYLENFDLKKWDEVARAPENVANS